MAFVLWLSEDMQFLAKQGYDRRVSEILKVPETRNITRGQ